MWEYGLTLRLVWTRGLGPGIQEGTPLVQKHGPTRCFSSGQISVSEPTRHAAILIVSAGAPCGAPQRTGN